MKILTISCAIALNLALPVNSQNISPEGVELKSNEVQYLIDFIDFHCQLASNSQLRDLVIRMNCSNFKSHAYFHLSAMEKYWTSEVGSHEFSLLVFHSEELNESLKKTNSSVHNFLEKQDVKKELFEGGFFDHYI